MEFQNEIPIYLQIMNYIKTEIVVGNLLKGEKLLSTRELAGVLKVNPNTIQRVYKELESEAICFSKRGLGTFVTEDTQAINHLRQSLAREIIEQFVHGMARIGFSKNEMIEAVNDYSLEQDIQMEEKDENTSELH